MIDFIYLSALYFHYVVVELYLPSNYSRDQASLSIPPAVYLRFVFSRCYQSAFNVSFLCI